MQLQEQNVKQHKSPGNEDTEDGLVSSRRADDRNLLKSPSLGEFEEMKIVKHSWHWIFNDAQNLGEINVQEGAEEKHKKSEEEKEPR
jgi:hypothetical protein